MMLQQAEELAQRLMRLHELPREWSFVFDRSKLRFGRWRFLSGAMGDAATGTR
jgi:hypothetical protein